MPNQTSAASRRGLNVLVSLVLFFGVVTLYWPAASYPFIGFDDGEYVSQNAQILPGLSWHGLGWAFTSFDAANWHPLTWLSHMLDCQLFGLNPGRHHLHNVLLHALNTCLLFVVLRRLTGAVWRSAFVAALFAVHPLHVESVAWISERKDVQSTFFFLLTLWAYARYATGNQKSEGRSPKSGNVPVTSELRPLTCEHYWLALLFFALGLMSKPMLVTLPFVLLLLDFWPLKRFELKTQHSQLKTLLPLLAEKLPFFTLTIVSCVLTCLAQKHAIRSLVELPLSDRLANAVVSCGLYVAEFLWPAGLAVFYALRHWPISEILPAIVFLVLVSAWALWRARQSPWLLAGWAWYLGTLVPVLGLVQVGSQSMADRYTYVPSIGLSIMLAFSLSATGFRKVIVSGLCLAALAALATCCSLQLCYWRNNLDLFLHDLSVTLPSSASTYEVGVELTNARNYGQALYYLDWACRLAPDDPLIHAALARCMAEGGLVKDGIAHFRALLRLDPNSPSLRISLANLLSKAGQYDEAVTLFSEALRAQPDPVTHYNLALTLTRQGRLKEAESHYLAALQLRPDLSPACERLAMLLFGQSRFPEAADRFRRLLKLRPDNAEAHSVLGLCLVAQNKPHDAVPCFREAIRLDPALQVPMNELAWILATDQDARVRNGPEALDLALRACALTTNREPSYLGTLDAAYAESGRFNEAIATAQKALGLFLASGDTNLARMAEQRLQLYRAARPYRQGSIQR